MKYIQFLINLILFSKDQSKGLWLVSLLLLCMGSNAMSQTLLMTKETKDILTDISDNYVWKTVPIIVNHDLEEFLWYMEQSNGSEKITMMNCHPQDRNLDKFWEAEKDSLDVAYGNRISKLNKVQRTLLFEKLNDEWKSFVKNYRYNCALYNAHINCNRYIGLLKEQKEDSLSYRNELSLILENLSNLEKENKSNTTSLSTLKKELDGLYVKENRLYSENQQLRYDLERQRLLNDPVALEKYEQKIRDLSFEITELEYNIVPGLIKKFEVTKNPRTWQEIQRNKEAATQLAESLDKLMSLSKRAYNMCEEIGSNLAAGFANTYNRADATRSELTKIIGY